MEEECVCFKNTTIHILLDKKQVLHILHQNLNTKPKEQPSSKIILHKKTRKRKSLRKEIVNNNGLINLYMSLAGEKQKKAYVYNLAKGIIDASIVPYFVIMGFCVVMFSLFFFF